MATGSGLRSGDGDRGESGAARRTPGRRAWGAAVVLVLAAIAVGCGSSRQASTGGTATVPAYGQFPANTITVGAGSPRSSTCRVDARAFVSLSRLYLVHKGPLSVYPSDVAYMNMRQDLADFAVRRCDSALLGEALGALSARQRSALVGYVPRPMAASLRQALAAVGG